MFQIRNFDSLRPTQAYYAVERVNMNSIRKGPTDYSGIRTTLWPSVPICKLQEHLGFGISLSINKCKYP